MNLIDAFQPSLTSLLILLLTPFIYFIYHRKAFYDPRILIRGGIALKLISVALIAVVVLKLMRAYPVLSWTEIQLLLMHLIPLIITIVVVNHDKKAAAFVPSSDLSVVSKQDGFAPVNRAVEDIGWNDLIIDLELKKEFVSIIDLLSDPEQAKKYGIDVPKGILLHGPPGTGKTTLAKVVARTANMHFFVLYLDEIVSKWVGESEKNLSRLFQTAKANAPAVIFVDEVDSIGRGRSERGETWSENLLNHFLQLLDGVVKTEGLYIIAATNRPDLVDAALKRPGRLTREVEIPLPGLEARAQLFNLYLAKLALEENLDLQYLAKITEGKSGADIKEICNDAGLNAFKRESGSNEERNYTVSTEDLVVAIQKYVDVTKVDISK